MSLTEHSLHFAAAAFDALSTHIAILDSEGRIVLENRTWRLFSCENGGGSTLGVNYLGVCEQAVGDGAEAARATAQGIRQVLSGETELYEQEYPCHSPLEERHFSVRVTPFEQGTQRYALVAHENITRRKQAELEVRRLNNTLEKRVLERTEQLERSNRELSQMTQVVAHDLQEPLRIIGSYSDLLAHRFGDQLSDRGGAYLQHIQQHTGRARERVRALAQLTSISAPQQLQRVDPAQEWATVWQDLPAKVASSASVTVGPLPPVLGDPEQLRTVFAQLLSNAVQFRSERPLQLWLSSRQPRLDKNGALGASRPPIRRDLVQIGLRDNGRGLPPGTGDATAPGLFRRLHVGSLTGQGAGLAICEKIIQLHGGDLWLENHPPSDQGAPGGLTVWLTLPRWQPGRDTPADGKSLDWSPDAAVAPTP